jgi:hypothetical protein
VLPNGLCIVVDRAVDAVDDPVVRQFRAALVLGALRENVVYVPGLRAVFPHLSFSHFYRPGLPGGYLPFLWPGPRFKATRIFRRALAEHGRGRTAAAFVQLGRIVHLIADMACPVHAHRVAHETIDPYEWWIEAHEQELRRLPVPAVPTTSAPAALIEQMARITARHPPDTTCTLWGRALQRAGFGHRTTAAEAGRQAAELVPTAAGFSAALLRLFLRDVEARSVSAG